MLALTFRDVRLSENHAFFREPIDIRSGDIGAAKRSGIAIAKVIDKEQDDVRSGLAGFRPSGLIAGQNQKDCDAIGFHSYCLSLFGFGQF